MGKDTGVEDKILEKFPSLEDSFLYDAQVEKQDIKRQEIKTVSETHLNVDDPGVKIEDEEISLSKKNSPLF